MKAVDASRMVVDSVQVGMPRALETDRGTVTSAILKVAVPGRVAVGALGLHGDAQGDTTNHGGPDKAMCTYPKAHYAHWESRLGRPLPPGAFGENLTLDGIDEVTACIGDVLVVGTARVQVSQPRTPCYKLAARHGEPRLADWVLDHGGTGWYFRVLMPGDVWAGAPMTLEARPHPDLTIAEANRVMFVAREDREAIRRLLVPELAESWAGRLRRRLAGEE